MEEGGKPGWEERDWEGGGKGGQEGGREGRREGGGHLQTIVCNEATKMVFKVMF